MVVTTVGEIWRVTAAGAVQELVVDALLPAREALEPLAVGERLAGGEDDEERGGEDDEERGEGDARARDAAGHRSIMPEARGATRAGS